MRATIDADLQIVAAKALRKGLEDYDRALGLWRGTGKTIKDLSDWQSVIARCVYRP